MGESHDIWPTEKKVWPDIKVGERAEIVNEYIQNDELRNLLSNALKQSLDEFLNTSQNQLDVYSRIYNNAEESEREDINNQIESIKNTVKDVINYYLLNEGKNEGNQTKLLDFMYKSRYFDFLLLVIDRFKDNVLNDYAKGIERINTNNPHITVDWRSMIEEICEWNSQHQYPTK